MIGNGLRTPDGFRDYLPKEYFFKRRVEETLESVFNGYGYSSVNTPTLEYAEVFADKGSTDLKQTYRMIDQEGNLLALRPDLTPAIARIVAANYPDCRRPLRFCYVQNVYRCSPSYQGRVREITQGGIELIGATSGEADAETLAVAIDALLKSGMEDFRIDVGQVRFLEGMLEESGLDPHMRDTLRERVIARDFVAAERIGRELNVPPNMHRMLSDLPLFCGGAEILDAALNETECEKSREALANLKNIHSALEDYGFEKYVLFDLSMAGNMDYYTGIIFKGYASGLGFSILDGGRYDSLLSRFGTDRPAVGFIIKVHNLMDALEKQNGREHLPGVDFLIAWNRDGRRAAFEEASRLRADGLRVVCAHAACEADAVVGSARGLNVKNALYFDGREAKLFAAEDGSF
ncbi:MAG: ATP phosphoribosyltransferase regulatory subunit [Synergistaceae bacterium]|jgi:ATP phosphoribosyltransferase regulatory subunit|nr:ATP phosphoribosyltransferase regulatory subunit [Synergistaceae bacterium]